MMNRFLNRLIAAVLGAIVVSASLLGVATVAAEQDQDLAFGCNRIIKDEVNGLTVIVESDAFYGNGAVLIDRTYHFGDGTQITTNEKFGARTLHTYREAGDYEISVVFRFNVNGHMETVSDVGCQTTFTAEFVHPVPTYTCDSLTVNATEKSNTYVHRFTYTADGGATLTGAAYYFGDGSMSGELPVADAGEVEHYYKEAGIYVIAVVLHFNVGSGDETNVRTATCRTIVEITTASILI